MPLLGHGPSYIKSSRLLAGFSIHRTLTTPAHLLVKSVLLSSTVPCSPYNALQRHTLAHTAWCACWRQHMPAARHHVAMTYSVDTAPFGHRFSALRFRRTCPVDDAMYAAPCTGGEHVIRTLLHCSAHLLGACTAAHNVESARRGRQVGVATTTVPYNAKVAARPPHNRSIMDSGTMTPSTVLPAPVKSMLVRVTRASFIAGTLAWEPVQHETTWRRQAAAGKLDGMPLCSFPNVPATRCHQV